LTHSNADSSISAKGVDIATDGSAVITAQSQSFERAAYAYQDSLKPIASVAPGAVDFGGGAGESTGSNVFIGAHATEIDVTRRSETVYALDDFWNPKQQQANGNGQYNRKVVFSPGASGKNVTIDKGAAGSTVTVGPAVVPTPTPSPSPTPT
jgi:hypothetical protein